MPSASRSSPIEPCKNHILYDTVDRNRWAKLLQALRFARDEYAVAESVSTYPPRRLSIGVICEDGAQATQRVRADFVNCLLFLLAFFGRYVILLYSDSRLLPSSRFARENDGSENADFTFTDNCIIIILNVRGIRNIAIVRDMLR